MGKNPLRSSGSWNSRDVITRIHVTHPESKILIQSGISMNTKSFIWLLNQFMMPSGTRTFAGHFSCSVRCSELIQLSIGVMGLIIFFFFPTKNFIDDQFSLINLPRGSLR